MESDTVFRIFLVNCALSQLRHKIDSQDFIEQQYDLAIICETRYGSNISVQLPFNLSPFWNKKRSFNENTQGGLAVAARYDSTIKHLDIQKFNFQPSDEIIITRVNNKPKNFIVVSIYNSPHTYLEESIKCMETLSDNIDLILFKENAENIIIVGDFNCHSPLLGNQNSNRLGKVLEKLVTENCLTIANPGMVTRPFNRDLDPNTGNNLDLLIHNFDFDVVAKRLNLVSDHYAISFEFNIAGRVKKSIDYTQNIRLIEKVDFSKFDATIHIKTQPFLKISTIDDARIFISKFNEALSAEILNIPQVSIGSKKISCDGPVLKKLQQNISEVESQILSTTDSVTIDILTDEKTLLIQEYNTQLEYFSELEYSRNLKNLNSKQKNRAFFLNLKNLSNFESSKSSVLTIEGSDGEFLSQKEAASAYADKLSLVYNKHPFHWDYSNENFENNRISLISPLMIDSNAHFANEHSGVFDPLFDQFSNSDSTPVGPYYNLGSVPKKSKLGAKILSRDKTTNKMIDNHFKDQDWANKKVFHDNLRDIQFGIKDCKSARACGPYGVSNKILKKLVYERYFSFYVTLMFHLILFFEFYPDDFKLSQIIGIPKVNICISLDDFRPISLIPIISRLFENRLLRKFIHRLSNSLNDKTTGYRFNIGVSETIFLIQAKIAELKFVKKASKIFLISVDIRKAFDSIPLLTLITLIKNSMCLSNKEKNILISWVKNRRYFVKSGNEVSRLITILFAGIAQGSAFSPALFNIVINTLITKLQKYQHLGLIISFADDVNILCDCPIVAQMILDDIQEWCLLVGLAVNVTKTKVLKFDTGVQSDYTLFFKGIPLKCVSTLRVLGFFFNELFNCETHINNQISKIAFRCRKIQSFNSKFHNMNDNVKSLLLKLQVQSVCDFNSLVFADSIFFENFNNFIMKKYRIATIFMDVDSELKMFGMNTAKQWLGVTQHLLPPKQRVLVSFCGFLFKCSSNNFVRRVMADLWKMLDVTTITTRSGFEKTSISIKKEFSNMTNSSIFVFNDSNLRFYNNIFNSFVCTESNGSIDIDYVKSTANHLALEGLIQVKEDDDSWLGTFYGIPASQLD